MKTPSLRFPTIFVLAAALLTWIPAQAAVIIGNSAVGPILDTSIRDTTISNYSNDGDFLVVTLVGSGGNRSNNGVPNVYYNGVPFSNISDFHSTTGDWALDSNDGYTWVGLMKNPYVGSADLYVDLAGVMNNGVGTATNARWRVGVQSLDNVNQVDPLASVYVYGGADLSFTMLPDNPGEIGEDSLLLYAGTDRNDVNRMWDINGIASNSGTNLFYNTVSSGWDITGTGGSVGTSYKHLQAGDLSGTNGDEVFMGEFGGRETVIALVFNDIDSGNQIPEPSSVGLTLFGVMLVGRMVRNHRKGQG